MAVQGSTVAKRGREEAEKKDPLRILVVCRWPVGGIRAYLTYLYSGFDSVSVQATALVCRSNETSLLEAAFAAAGHRVMIANARRRGELLFMEVARLLATERFDLIHSQGFISGVHASLANCLFRKKHVLTIHGIVEDRYISGRFSWLRRRVLMLLLRNASILHGVGRDILEHVKEVLPVRSPSDGRWTVIQNGILTEPFVEARKARDAEAASQPGVHAGPFVFGFFGRFMPQKGFVHIVEAVAQLIAELGRRDSFCVQAFGSGDLVREYQGLVRRRGLDDVIHFQPHTDDVPSAMVRCQAVLMPSVWEAYGLVASEVLTAGVPLIASDCIGLREVVRDTPAHVIPMQDSDALARAMKRVMTEPSVADSAAAFVAVAQRRFDVSRTRAAMMALFQELAR